MEIVDVHVHLVGRGFVKGKYVRETASWMLKRYNKVHGTNLSLSEFIDLRRWYIDPDGEKLLDTMDKSGVTKAVLFSVDWALYTGEPPVSVYEQNKIHNDLARKHPDRFISLCAIDPRRDNTMDLAKEAIEEWGMKGFKLMPSTGWYPDDPICYTLYEKCADWGVPILFHSGPETFWQYAHPMYIASAAARYPEVKMVMAHAGGIWWRDAMAAAAMLPNVWLDLSSWQPNYLKDPQKFYEWLREMIDEAGEDKLMWATDWALPDLDVHMPDWVKVFTEPKTDIKFTPEEIELIMGKNALDVFDFGK